MKELIEGQSMKGFLSARARRIVLAWMIFLSMCINGFMLKPAESGGSLTVIMTAVAGEMIIGTFKECTDTLVAMSNKITKSLYGYMFGEASGKMSGQKRGDGKEKKEPVPCGNGGDSVITSDRKVERDRIWQGGMNLAGGFGDRGYGEIAWRTYKPDRGEETPVGAMGIIYFILFIVVYRNRKGYDGKIKTREKQEI